MLFGKDWNSTRDRQDPVINCLARTGEVLPDRRCAGGFRLAIATENITTLL
jgi:hypothetical protein